MNSNAELYRQHYEAHLNRVAENLQALVSDHIDGVANIDRVTARAKDPRRFSEKITRRDNDGQPKYQAPLEEIQDQIGVRVVVFYLDTIDEVWAALGNYFRPIEEKTMVPESFWEFGYFGRHAVMALPGDVVPHDVATEEVPRFFELQVKTLFQHAWSEANHDLGYKPPEPLSEDHQRLLAFAAAQAWGADRALEELRIGLISHSAST